MREKDGLGRSYFEDAFALAGEGNEVHGLSHDLSKFSLSESARLGGKVGDACPWNSEDVEGMDDS